MGNILERFTMDTLVTLPEGTEQIRRFRDNIKWLSSNYQMCIPSKGINQEQILESVKIRSFQIAKYPVTNQLYNLILGSDAFNPLTNQQPKVEISWYESILFCNRISRYFGLTEYYYLDDNMSNVLCNSDSKGFRLATDAEWQYACKAGQESYQYSDIDKIAWHEGNSGGRLQNVGEKQPNEWGLYDMLGNVWEWTWDFYNQETYSDYRIFRGGGFADAPRICGATTRRKSHPDHALDDLGLRLARSL